MFDVLNIKYQYISFYNIFIYLIIQTLIHYSLLNINKEKIRSFHPYVYKDLNVVNYEPISFIKIEEDVSEPEENIEDTILEEENNQINFDDKSKSEFISEHIPKKANIILDDDISSPNEESINSSPLHKIIYPDKTPPKNNQKESIINESIPEETVQKESNSKKINKREFEIIESPFDLVNKKKKIEKPSEPINLSNNEPINLELRYSEDRGTDKYNRPSLLFDVKIQYYDKLLGDKLSVINYIINYSGVKVILPRIDEFIRYGYKRIIVEGDGYNIEKARNMMIRRLYEP